MGYDIIPLLIILVCITIIIIIVIRKFPLLVALDIESLAAERDAKIKKEIIDQRFYRFTVKIKSFFKKIFIPIGNFFSRFFKNLKSKAEQSYKDIEKKQIISLSKNKKNEALAKKDEVLNNYLNLAKEHFNKNEYSLAESRYIDVINIDGNNIKAYEGLVEVYSTQKDIEKEKETLFFILKLITKKANLKKYSNITRAKFYYKLAQININESDYILAIENLKQALHFEDSNPKYIDQLLEIVIMQKDINYAQELLLKLRNINPDNKKLTYYSQKIRELILRR